MFTCYGSERTIVQDEESLGRPSVLWLTSDWLTQGLKRKCIKMPTFVCLAIKYYHRYLEQVALFFTTAHRKKCNFKL